MKALEVVLELSTPELSDRSRSGDHEHLPGLWQNLQDVLDESRIIVHDGDGALVLAQRHLAEIALVHRREQERGVGQELLSMLARERRRGAGDRDDEIGLG